MDTVEEPTVSSPSSESKARTPAYASFDSSTDKLLHLLAFISRGVQSYSDELKTKIAPEVTRIVKEIGQLSARQNEESIDHKTDGVDCAEQNLSDARKNADINDRIELLSKTWLNPSNQFTGGLLTVREWVPVLIVTTVEAYLEDVLIYVAKVDPAIMESSRPPVRYAEVVKARSLEELKDE